MKKYLCSIPVIIMIVLLAGCNSGKASGMTSGGVNENTSYDSNGGYTNSATDASFSRDDYDYGIIGDLAKSDGYDVDLTNLSGNMVYAEVYDIMYSSSENYLGKSIRMKGAFDIYTDYYTKNEYTYCVIADALGCCAQGIEFVMPENMEPPELGAEIEVSGIFESYTENGNTFYRLNNTDVKVLQ